MPSRTRTTLDANHDKWRMQITDDGSRTLIDPKTQIAYHSASGALTETKHVYLRNSGVAERIARGKLTSVLEVGLGTAMGLLVTLDAAAGTPLQYTALEVEWLPANLIRRLLPWQWTNDPNAVDRFLDWRDTFPDVVPKGSYDWKCDTERSVRVEVGDAATWTPGFGTRFDAIYFDPFAPKSNDRLWQRSVLSTMHSALRKHGRLVTYCVSRQVRNDLSAAGFHVNVVPGPESGKREVLIATKSL